MTPNLMGFDVERFGLSLLVRPDVSRVCLGVVDDEI